MNENKQVEKQTKFVDFMTLDLYKKIETSVGSCSVNQITTDIEAGYKLGVQAVLKYLRDNHVQFLSR